MPLYVRFTALTLSLCIHAVPGLRAQSPFEGGFGEVRSQVRSLWFADDYEGAITLLRDHLGRYEPGYSDFTVYYYLGLLHADQGNPESSLEMLNAGMDRGYFYALSPGYLEKVEGVHGADALRRRNDLLRRAARDTSRVLIRIRLPRASNAVEPMPLLLFLHGNNSSLDWVEEAWKDVVLEAPFLVAMIQSSSPVSSYAYSWPDTGQSGTGVREAYEEIVSRYRVDTSRVILSGFSAGGRVALEAALRGRIPASGFIVFSPPKPQAFSDSLVLRGLASGLRGALITGEEDDLLPQALEMAHRLTARGFPLRVVIQSDQGHDYPGDFRHQLEESIDFILQGHRGR